MIEISGGVWQLEAVQHYLSAVIRVWSFMDCVLVTWNDRSNDLTTKVATLTYNTLPTSTSVYLFNLLSVHTPVRWLRSKWLNLRSKPLCKLKYSQPAFCFASPSLWNDLSEFVKSSIESRSQSIFLNKKTKRLNYFLVITSCTVSCRVSEW